MTTDATTTHQAPAPYGGGGAMRLSTSHYAMLHDGSGIRDEVIATRGYRSLTHPDDLIDRGFSKAQAKAAPALCIPLWDVHGLAHGWQMRPDCPRQMKDGKVFRYELPKGDRLILDVHPSGQPLLANPAVPLWITEGVKKADALVSQGACTIGLVGGVWGFRGSNEYGGKVILPDWQHVALNGRLVYVAFDSDLATKRGVQAALDALYTFLRSRGAIPARLRWPDASLQTKIGVDDYLAQGHTLDDLLAMIPQPGPLPVRPPPHTNGTGASDSDPTVHLPYSDYTNALAFVREHGKEVRYCPEWKTWLVWSGTHWQRDSEGDVMQRAKLTIKRLAARAALLSDAQAIADLFKQVKASLSTAKLHAMVESADNEPGIRVHPRMLDSNHWLLNCQNGTLDLKTRVLRPHQQEDYLTLCLDVGYDRAALCPKWDAFLWRIMGGPHGPDDPETMRVGELEHRRLAAERAQLLIDFLQRAIGYSLTGDTSEQCLFLLIGPTKSGKSTFLHIMRTLLGGYAKQADMSSFMHKERQEVRNDLADLAGSRFVCAVESQEGQRLGEDLVKQLTGGVDSIKARFLYEEYFEFRPQFKIFLGTNHEPIIRAHDDAIWERIRRVPFIVQIPKDDRDKHLEDALKSELPGILAWAVQGVLDWQQRGGLDEPDAVIETTKAYRAAMDDVGGFVREACTSDPDHKVKVSRLYEVYRTWKGGNVESQRVFNAALADRGYVSHRYNTGVFWQGIGLSSLDADTDTD